MLHSVHRCLIWCLQSSVVMRTWWPRTFSCISLPCIHIHPVEMCNTEQEAYNIYYTVAKWNYYLQGSDIIVCNDHKPLQKFLNGKNANNKVNRWSLELTTCNITFEWISGVHYKTAAYLLWLIDVKDTPVTPTTSINMLVTSDPESPATILTARHIPSTDTTTTTDANSMVNTDKVNTPHLPWKITWTLPD